jgi:hypothetical protein
MPNCMKQGRTLRTKPTPRQRHVQRTAATLETRRRSPKAGAAGGSPLHAHHLKLGAKGKELAPTLDQLDALLAALDVEEAELRRKLAVGELSREEEAAARRRLDGIARERAVLRAEKLSEIGKALSGLEFEEAELQRKLAAGLAPGEEAAVRRRLEELAAERAALKAKSLSELDITLLLLNDEETELRRRLESGELSAEEEATVRRRLEEIATERAGLQAEQKALRAEMQSSGTTAAAGQQQRQQQQQSEGTAKEGGEAGVEAKLGLKPGAVRAAKAKTAQQPRPASAAAAASDSESESGSDTTGRTSSAVVAESRSEPSVGSTDPAAAAAASRRRGPAVATTDRANVSRRRAGGGSSSSSSTGRIMNRRNQALSRAVGSVRKPHGSSRRRQQAGTVPPLQCNSRGSRAAGQQQQGHSRSAAAAASESVGEFLEPLRLERYAEGCVAQGYSFAEDLPEIPADDGGAITAAEGLAEVEMATLCAALRMRKPEERRLRYVLALASQQHQHQQQEGGGGGGGGGDKAARRRGGLTQPPQQHHHHHQQRGAYDELVGELLEPLQLGRYAPLMSSKGYPFSDDILRAEDGALTPLPLPHWLDACGSLQISLWKESPRSHSDSSRLACLAFLFWGSDDALCVGGGVCGGGVLKSLCMRAQ